MAKFWMGSKKVLNEKMRQRLCGVNMFVLPLKGVWRFSCRAMSTNELAQEARERN